ncbi:hypothetical protein HK096_001716, partial [Nowakowskiella sp. JEL0078]
MLARRFCLPFRPRFYRIHFFSSTNADTHSGPEAYYLSLLKANKLIDDPLQRITVNKLQDLHNRLLATVPPPNVDLPAVDPNSVTHAVGLDAIEQDASFTHI